MKILQQHVTPEQKQSKEFYTMELRPGTTAQGLKFELVETQDFNCMDAVRELRKCLSPEDKAYVQINIIFPNWEDAFGYSGNTAREFINTL